MQIFLRRKILQILKLVNYHMMRRRPSYYDHQNDGQNLQETTSCIPINNRAGQSGCWTDEQPYSKSFEETNGTDDTFSPAHNVRLQMSIWQELGAHQPEPNQHWTGNAVVWRRYDDEDSGFRRSNISADEEVERFSSWSAGEREHEERRIVERFASFPTKVRPVEESAGTAGSGAGTPRSTRRRNKRKGCDSPRNTTGPVEPDQSTETDQELPNVAGQGVLIENFDMAQLRDDVPADEPMTSHRMRPARGWASILPDEEEDHVTVSPRVLSPEEPAGSFQARGYYRCREPQEGRRTTFVALGKLSSQPIPDEHPATLRARQLIQQIHSLKCKVKLYEDAFEQRFGYRPSHHQKMDDRNTKRILTELARVRKELKQLKERYHLTEPVEYTESKDPAGLTTSTTFYNKENGSVEHTVLEVQEHLADHRQLAGRPESVDELSAKEVLDEKLAVQRALLYVESIHGRPASYKHKDLLRPLYDRYRLLKRMVVRSGISRSKEDVCDLAPILEYETLDLSSSVPHRHSAPSTPSFERENDNARNVRRQLPSDAEFRRESRSSSWHGEDPLLLWKRQKISINIEENLHALPLNQLMEQLRNVREEKRRLRRAIRDLEADALRPLNGPRYSSFNEEFDDEDEYHIEPVYAQYRHARAKLRLLEALVAKHDGSATL